MKIYLELDVTNCRNCILRGEDRGHGSMGSFCQHPESPEGYGAMIADIDHIPTWCPGNTKKNKDENHSGN